MNNTQSLSEAMTTLSKMPKIDIKGKQYASVASRVEAFRKHFSTAGIETILIHDDNQRVIIQAKISIENTLIATGYAEEFRGDGWINSTSALENAETSAIGRALSAFGLSGSEYASSNEVTNAITQQTHNKQLNDRKPLNKHNSSYSPNNQTPKQIEVSPAPYQNQQDFSKLTNLGLSVIQQDEYLIVVGDGVFENKEIIKQHGFRWDGTSKSWYMQLSQAS